MSNALKFENGTIVELTEEEKAAIEAAVQEYGRKEAKRPLEPDEVYQVMVKAMVNQADIDDKTSLRMKDYYPTFEEIVGTEVKEGFKFTYEGDLWKTRQEHTPSAEYPPSVDTASLYERIDEENKGTREDPIPYDTTMTVYKDLYYSYKDKLYLCIQNSGQPLYAEPEYLLGNFFEEIDTETGETVEPVESDGTKEKPYPYDPNTAVTNGKYYIYNDVVYLCIRDSGNPLYADPATLLDNYFKLAE